MHIIPSILSEVSGYGGYVSPIKLAIFAAMFLAWMPLVNWIHTDAQSVRTKVNFWTGFIAVSGAATILIWLFVPLFLVGLLLYLVAVGATLLAYAIHRNSKVAEFEKILTIRHIKSIFVNEDKKMKAASKGIAFITANNNEVPLPEAKSPEAFGFKFACELFEDAIWRRASDIIFQPKQDSHSIAYRIDGVIVAQEPRSREETEYFIRYLKMMADLDIKERRKPQTGTFKLLKDETRIEWKATTAGSTAGEQVVLCRLEEHNLTKIEDIGFDNDQVEQLSVLKGIQSGLIIISGPKKSGVTSSFYAFIRNHDPFMNNINTLEKQPAGELANVTQNIYTLSDTGSTTYAKRLQSILRMGPDIMGVADCNDRQIAQLACTAAKDGKLVYVTLEAANITQALGRWLKLVPKKELAAEVLVAITNQRLIRQLCSSCKQAYQPNQNLLRKFNIPADKVKLFYKSGEIEYDKHGKPILCEECQGTGFVGRTGVFESFVLDEKSKEVLRRAKSMQEVADQFRRSGLIYMQEQAVKRVAVGLTSINEIIREFSDSKPDKGKEGKKPK
jgi:type II secretory ATPase GspE/PulE/Tfp pilus assembly ATPase PilB-like protein